MTALPFTVAIRPNQELFNLIRPPAENWAFYNTNSSQWARAMDGYKSRDVGIELVAGEEVTTSLVLTGAQSIMSGEGYVFKMKRGDYWV